MNEMEIREKAALGMTWDEFMDGVAILGKKLYEKDPIQEECPQHGSKSQRASRDSRGYYKRRLNSVTEEEREKLLALYEAGLNYNQVFQSAGAKMNFSKTTCNLIIKDALAQKSGYQRINNHHIRKIKKHIATGNNIAMLLRLKVCKGLDPAEIKRIFPALKKEVLTGVKEESGYKKGGLLK